ncbi:bifunctional metallophosphatase/5'-nucleotidase [Butyricimonas synergistica]|uniref:bifunctional metallophosphatase/5'-nucleotidase n=1 Tax=Butyricimonas synergistica TaxID=544644 RepID=UPI00039B19CC|nr:bifunctional UDP-sugar hydrolase/5'-nucleotidase [Butyricimonas synergistica]
MKSKHMNKRATHRPGIYFRDILLFFLLLLAGCKPTEKEIVIISTNDIHGHIDQFPQLATFVERVKARHPNVILVDAGDRFTGDPYVDYADERGKPIITIMDSLGYSVGTFGNHEFDYGQRILRQRINEASFPIVCANINSSRAKLDTVPPYHTITVGELRLCFLGIVETSKGTPDANPTHFDSITFDDFRQTASRYKYLKQECDALIGLTHLGIHSDSILATHMPELDVIIGGHTHTLLDKPKIVNNVMIGQTGATLTHAGITILKFSGKKLTQRSYRSVPIDTITVLHPATLALVRHFRDTPRFDTIVGTTSRPLTVEAIARLLTSAMRQAVLCDFAFYNRGGIRVSGIPAGDITLKTLLAIEPFSNHIVVQEMTVDDIKQLLLNRFNELLPTVFDDLFMGGGTFTIVRDSSGKGIDVLLRNPSGTPLVPNKRYKVALNDYINARYDFPGKGNGIHSEISVIATLLTYLKQHAPL